LTCPRCNGTGGVNASCPHCAGVGDICDGAEGCLMPVVMMNVAVLGSPVRLDLCSEHLREVGK
jgi:hypothetical protein